MIDWRHWHNEPYLIGGLVVIAWLYSLTVGPFRGVIRTGADFSSRRAWAFTGFIVLFYLAVGSPLDQIGEQFLFSAHMIQHQILMYGAAPLFVVSLPPWLIEAIFSPRALRAFGRFWTHPIPAGLTYVLIYSLWHVPEFYDAALRNKPLHIVEHVTMFGGAVLFWWPLLSSSPVLPRARPAVQMLYIFVVTVGMTPAFALITFSEHVLYPTYEYAPRIINLDPMEDQMLGGVIMKLGGMAIALAAFAWAFVQWNNDASRRHDETRA